MTKYIRIPKKPDPFTAEISARLALKQRSSKREHTPEGYVAPKRLRAVGASLRPEAVLVELGDR